MSLGNPHVQTLRGEEEMLYRLIRWIAGITLRWFYRDVEIVGLDRVPSRGPVLLAVNHPNALIDALMVVHVLRRRVTLTAKATLFDVPVLAGIMRGLGIVPLRRMSDEAKHDPTSSPDPARNAAAFDAIVDALTAGAAVLIFPEGKSHSAPELAPLRTGLARIALRARAERDLHALSIVPVGLTFEEKWRPRTRVFVGIGTPVEISAMKETGEQRVRELTSAVDQALRAMTLNFETADEAASSIAIAHILSATFEAPRPLADIGAPLATESEVVRRVQATRAVLAPVIPGRMARFVERLDALRAELAKRRIAPGDISIASGVVPGTRFVLREGAIIAIPGIAALWGRINHAVPIAAARSLARRLSRTPDDPAMYTIGIALGLVLAAYAIQTAIVWRIADGGWALLYLLSLPSSGLWDQRFRDRMRRARERMRTYLHFRRDPALQTRLATEVEWLRTEALALEALAQTVRHAPVVDGREPKPADS